MATESPLRLIGSSGARNWPTSIDTASFTSSSNVAAPELEFLLQGNGFHGSRDFTGLSRSGSAPPSMEGSSLAIDNLKRHQNFNLEGFFENLTNPDEGSETKGQLLSDIAYYYSNTNLNPRLPRESCRVVHNSGAFGDSRKILSFDDSIKGSSFMSRSVLATHKEESEDDKSPRIDSDGKAEASSAYVSGPMQEIVRHKSIVDLIQHDFPRTPSPVYNNQSHQSSHGSTEPTDSDSSGSLTRADSKTDTIGVRTRIPSIPGVQSVPLNPKNNVSASLSPSSTSSGQKGEPRSLNTDTKNGVLHSSGRVAGSNIGGIENEMMNLRISDDGHRNQFAQPYLQPRGSSYDVQIGQSQVVTNPVMSWPNNSVDHLSHGQPKLPTSEVQPALISSGVAPPLYATAAAYGSPYYANLQPSSLFHPQFPVGGYAMNAPLVPPFMTGYSPYTAIPMPLESPVSSNFGTRAPVVSTGGGVSPVADMQNLYKFYGQFGVGNQPSFSEPVFMPYFQHPYLDAYASTGQYDTGNPVGNYDLQRGHSLASQASDQRPAALRIGSVNILASGKGGTPTYSGRSQNVPVLMQYPTSPVASPLFQGSPAAGRRNENTKFPFNSGRTGAAYSGWHGYRCQEKIDDQRPPSFLEELKSSKSRRYELSDIAGRIVEFSADQHGSRFIQQKLETCNAEEKASVFQEVLPHASALMTDVFGNYVIQKFFEHGNPDQRKELANKLVGHVLPLSLQMYGCRVIQKALEVIDIDQKTELVRELEGHVMRCVRDQNGNHVIQKCIECVPTKKIDFIISSFQGHVASLSMHPYGCRVIQRVLEHCSDEVQSQCIINEILQSACILAQDQYGNYVTQHVLERGKPLERSQVIRKLAGQIVQMSQHKFSSNVIEKCLEYGSQEEHDLLIEEIVGQTEGNDNLLVMMKDQFANYVVQKILETCKDKQREILLGRIRAHLQALKKYTYGKHIVARVEQLCEEEPQASES